MTFESARRNIDRIVFVGGCDVRAVLEIRPDLKAALDHLAVETHRSESDLANEAVASYLERSRLIAVRAREKRVTVGGTIIAG